MWINALPPFIVDQLSVFGLIIIGFLVEKQYVSRPAIFANTLAINVHVSQQSFPPNWLVWYANIGLLVGGFAITAYASDESLSGDFYTLAMVLYSSLPVAAVIYLTL